MSTTSSIMLIQTFRSAPVTGCQSVLVGTLVRPSYLSKVEIEGNPNCIIDSIDYEKFEVRLKLNRRDLDPATPLIVITKDDLLPEYGFYQKL
jgi:hypothetical protein